MGIFRDLTGNVFERLTVLSREGKNKHGGILWNCICSCGAICVVNGDSMKSGITKSCGCLKAKLGGATRQQGSLYKTWRAMMRRCYESNHHAFASYGGRGIYVCEQWYDYLTFENDLIINLGVKPLGLELDRVNNDGPYSPDNCKWSTKSEQALNRRNSWITRRENISKKKGEHESNN